MWVIVGGYNESTKLYEYNIFLSLMAISEKSRMR